MMMTKGMTLKQMACCCVVAAMLVSTVVACSDDAYDKGEGEYSLMQAELADAVVDADKSVGTFVTDNDRRYAVSRPVVASWLQKGDTTCRVAVYFREVETGVAECLSMSALPTLRPIEHWRVAQQWNDPVGLESVWAAKNGKYVNMALLLKSGQTDDKDAVHQIALLQDTVMAYDNGKRTAYYRLTHSQNGMPEYYTNRHYVSIVLPEERPDTVRLRINTYQGEMEKTILVSR